MKFFNKLISYNSFLNKIVTGDNLMLFAIKIKEYIYNELLGGKKIKYVTQAQYDALSDSEKNDEEIVWNITDEDIDITLIRAQYITQLEYEELLNSNTLDESVLYIINDGLDYDE